MIKVRKIKESEPAEFKAANWDDYIQGIDNGLVSLPVEYTVEGEYADEEPKKGGFIYILREKRNGVKCPGIFRSSRISSVKKKGDNTIVETNNSVYLIEKVES